MAKNAVTREYIHHSNLIEGIDDPAADDASMLAWQFLESKVGLSINTILEVQRMITETQDTLTHEQRGRFRTIWVSIGGRLAVNPMLVGPMMNNWLLDYKGRDPIINHIAFEKIHPFVDGNGRTGRMLMWWMEIQKGLDPTMIKISEQQAYYDWFV